MSTDRPSLTPKTTRKTEQKRTDALDTGMRITWEGKTYQVTAGDLTAMHSHLLRRSLGMSFNGLQEALWREPDIDLFAAIIWLARLLDGEHGLTYEEVAESMSYAKVEGLEIVITPPAKDGEDPEA